MILNFFKDAEHDFSEIRSLGITIEPFDMASNIDADAMIGNHFGYKTKRPLKIVNFNSNETNCFYLDISKSFNIISTSKKDVAYYRYCLIWDYNIIHKEEQDDYFHESLITLKRSIRFDYHPHVQSPFELEKEPHWHPNGCSELKAKTEKLHPYEAIAFCAKFFSPDIFSKFSEKLKERINNIF